MGQESLGKAFDEREDHETVCLAGLKWEDREQGQTPGKKWERSSKSYLKWLLSNQSIPQYHKPVNGYKKKPTGSS